MFTGDPRQHVHVVRIMSAGRRMHDGWRQVDTGGPVKRFLAGLAVVLLAVPMLILGIVAILVILAIAAASALVAFVLGGRPGTTPPTEPGRENVRVIRRQP